MGKYQKGQTRNIPDGLARVYLRSNIAVEEYEQKVTTSISRKEFVESLDEFDSMSLDDLKALAKERGLKVHHLAGAEKTKQILRGDSEVV